MQLPFALSPDQPQQKLVVRHNGTVAVLLELSAGSSPIWVTGNQLLPGQKMLVVAGDIGVRLANKNGRANGQAHVLGLVGGVASMAGVDNGAALIPLTISSVT